MDGKGRNILTQCVVERESDFFGDIKGSGGKIKTVIKKDARKFSLSFFLLFKVEQIKCYVLFLFILENSLLLPHKLSNNDKIAVKL